MPAVAFVVLPQCHLARCGGSSGDTVRHDLCTRAQEWDGGHSLPTSFRLVPFALSSPTSWVPVVFSVRKPPTWREGESAAPGEATGGGGSTMPPPDAKTRGDPQMASAKIGYDD